MSFFEQVLVESFRVGFKAGFTMEKKSVLKRIGNLFEKRPYASEYHQKLVERKMNEAMRLAIETTFCKYAKMPIQCLEIFKKKRFQPPVVKWVLPGEEEDYASDDSDVFFSENDENKDSNENKLSNTLFSNKSDESFPNEFYPDSFLNENLSL